MEDEEQEELEETAQEKKLRLAKLYLEQLREQGEPVSWAGRGGACARACLLQPLPRRAGGLVQVPSVLRGLPALWEWSEL